MRNTDCHYNVQNLWDGVLDEKGIPHEVHLIVRQSDPGEDLIRLAAKHEIDEMVIGFKLRSTIDE